jgi:hypothetical protein
METSVPVVVATISQSLATFIKQELAETNVTVQLLTDPDLFFKRLKNIKPEIILLDASYPTGEKSASLAKTLLEDLTWQDTPLVIVKTFFEPLDELFPEIESENILTQPFTRADLLTILQRISPQAINNHRQNQDISMTETSENLQEPDVKANQEDGIIELTDMVKEGIPLDQLPPGADHDTAFQEPTPATETLIDTELEEDIAFPSDAAIDELAFTAGEEMEAVVDLSVPDESPATKPEEEGLEKSMGSDSIEETFDKTAETDSEAEAVPEDFTTESPEDHPTPDDEKPVTPPETSIAAKPETARPSVVTEPQTADFSQQIEGLTQEWSKKMLVSTYASMDKLIQALGDMAPTIVEQVAREIIPPLAEKIIKSEIQRLEKKIEDDHT